MSVLAFIILGSIIRQINLLVLLSGLMIAPFFFNWRISMKMLERVRVSRKLPEWVHAATPFSVRWLIRNERQQIPSWGVQVIDHIRSEPAAPAAPNGVLAGKVDKDAVEQVTVQVQPIQAGASRESSYQCFLPRRGIYEFGPARVRSAFPFGLFRSMIKVPEIQKLAVAPRQGKLTRSWSQLTQARNDGQQSPSSRRNDHEGEFYAIRQWQSGDNRRQIHWRSTARHNELMVRQLEQKTDTRLLLVLDLCEGEFDPGHDQAEHALSFFATALANLAGGSARHAVAIFGDQTMTIERFERRRLAQAMNCLATLAPGRERDAEKQMETLLSLARHGRAVVISTRARPAYASDLVCHWIDVNAGQASSYFQIPDDPTEAFIRDSIGPQEVKTV